MRDRPVRPGAVRPTSRGIGTVAVGFLLLAGAAALGRRDLLIVAVALLALPMASLLVLRHRTAPVGMRLRIDPPVIRPGESALLSLGRPGSSRLSGAPAPSWRCGLPAGLRDLGPAAVERGRDAIGGRRVTASRRGVFPLGPPTLDMADLFGLMRRPVPIGAAAVLVAAPEPLEMDWPALLGGGAEGAAGTRYWASDRLDEMISRPYRPGDPMRRVEWRSSARTGRLMVRQEERAQDPGFWLVADTRVPSRQPHGRDVPDEEFETALRAIAAVGEFAAASRRDLRIVEVGGHGLAGARPGDGLAAHYRPEEARSLLPRELAGLRPSDPPDAVPSAVPWRRLSARSRPGSSGAVGPLGPEPDPADALLAVLGATSSDIAERLCAWAGRNGTAIVVGDSTAAGVTASRMARAGWHVVRVGGRPDPRSAEAS